jgi:hypothetical protein
VHIDFYGQKNKENYKTIPKPTFPIGEKPFVPTISFVYGSFSGFLIDPK